MKNKFIYLSAFAGCLSIATFYLPGCKKPENLKASSIKPEVTLTDSRVNVIHLYKDTVYILKGELERKENEELVIDAGTLIKVISNDFNDLGGITIDPGGIIRVNGTSNEPVVFTSNVYTGNQKENWNGIKILGKAKNNSRGNTGDSLDFSGSLTYVRIEFAALMLDAVGSGTTLENIMVSYTNTSGQLAAPGSFKFYGGSVNAKNLISYACGGPADFYLTNGYNGKMQNILAYRNPFFGDMGISPINALAGIVIENNADFNTGALPYTYPFISNLTVLGPNTINGSAPLYADTNNTDLRSAAFVADGNAYFRIKNSLLLGFPRGGMYVNDGSTGHNIEVYDAEISNSILHANDSARTFYLNPLAYPPFTSVDLRNYLVTIALNNKVYSNAADFMFRDPFNYESPNLLPADNSPVLSGADFTDPVFNDAFFNKVNYLGATGTDNWLQGWTNFIPLRTNYNFAE